MPHPLSQEFPEDRKPDTKRPTAPSIDLSASEALAFPENMDLSGSISKSQQLRTQQVIQDKLVHATSSWTIQAQLMIKQVLTGAVVLPKNTLRQLYQRLLGVLPASREAEKQAFDELLDNLFNGADSTSTLNPSLKDLKLSPAIKLLEPCPEMIQAYFNTAYIHPTNHSLSSKAIVAVVSADAIFPLFCDLVSALGRKVDVYLETSHGKDPKNHTDYLAEEIDKTVAQSYIAKYEDLLMNDGDSAISVLGRIKSKNSHSYRAEIQFTADKMLIIYCNDMRRFPKIFAKHGVACKPEKEVIAVYQTVHKHVSNSGFADEFHQFARDIHAEEA